ncbi:hypothetical protein EA473_19950 [Natrarchaeobius chitinivorans]|uniref:Uncharacterized protein n=1 Tax=Natrarchaeobius chitinivorans TaxID=1679083 RepID=A0A3N6M6E2_NATCH|nr:hypothetical protein EA473_19950 [Natrarchaeobius chitinivorans]
MLAARSGRVAESLTPFAPRVLPRFPQQNDARYWLILLQRRSRSRPRGTRAKARARARVLDESVDVESHGWRVVESEEDAE